MARATVVSAAESTARKGEDLAARLYFGLARPRFPVLGTSFAGEVQAVGSAGTKYRVGNQVMGSVGPALGAMPSPSPHPKTASSR